MSEEHSDIKASRAVHRLTIAIWALTAVMFCQMVLTFTAFVVPRFLTHRLNKSSFGSSANSSRMADEEQYNDFHDWPLARQIKAASVIALTKYEKDGDHYKCLIAEILKQQPNTEF